MSDEIRTLEPPREGADLPDEAASVPDDAPTWVPPTIRTTPREDLIRGFWEENPVLVQLLGLCPTLAVTNTVQNSVAMGLATFFVLTGSSLLVSTFKNVIPHEVRISSYILIIATFVTVADLVLAATVPEIHKELGAFVPLIVVNCMILGRQEAFASKRPVSRSLLDAFGSGAGFIVALLLMGTIREVIGQGSFWGYPLFGAHYEPWIIMILPPGGFLTLGFILLWLGWWRGRKAAPRPSQIRSWPHGVRRKVTIGGPTRRAS